ncbi:Disease resistance-responsive (dirigent-like protein) family protein [Euphorbia peplus]|nr:Disease resistance-responsive (dirigent-like protein) family protein [Euphorbia peplus]
MENTSILSLLLIFSITTSPVFSQYYSQTVPYQSPPEKITNLHFFFHDTLSGKNPSAVLVARPNITASQSRTQFGEVYAVDDPLTVGPELTSEVIGNAQGLYVLSGQDLLSLVSYLDFGFTKGEFNGSSISVLSRNPVLETERELAVVGGRGKFRFAKGFAHLKTYFVNAAGDAIVEYNVTIVHY